MPPSISRSEALVIWMLRIAMNAPTMPATTAIQAVALAFSDEGPAVVAGPIGRGAAVCVMVDIAPSSRIWAGTRSPLVCLRGYRPFGGGGHIGRRNLGVNG